MDKFLHRLRQNYGNIVTLDVALDKINAASFKKKMKKKLRRLIKLAYKCNSLNDVQKKMHIKKNAFKRLLDKLYKFRYQPDYCIKVYYIIVLVLR